MPSTKIVSSPESESTDAFAAKSTAAELLHRTSGRTPGSTCFFRIADSHTASASARGRQRATWNKTLRMWSAFAVRATGDGPEPQCITASPDSRRDAVLRTAMCVVPGLGTQSFSSSACVTHVTRPLTAAAAARRGSTSGVVSHERRTRMTRPAATAAAIAALPNPSARNDEVWPTPSCAFSHFRTGFSCSMGSG
jgi:hypothetical protein